MNKFFCNPLNIPYKYQFIDDKRNNRFSICREAADPSLILFEGRYYLFASMSLGVYVSDDLVNWEYRELPKNLPLYDYAPDVRIRDGFVYFTASSREHNCYRYRTRDILNGPYEVIRQKERYWDPNLFFDDDGRVYFYHGCTNYDPIWGVELDRDTFRPITKKQGLVYGNPYQKGFERIGPNNSIYPSSEEETEEKYRKFMKGMKVPSFLIPKKYHALIKGMFRNTPYIEGAWMDKFNGRYYLQYAAPGTQYNTYSDTVYVSDNPLSGFVIQENSPFSFKPGGFINGAGHGSTLKDKYGNLWHTSTMSISVNHDFERRIGLFRSGIDEDGELYCNQNFADYPYDINDLIRDPWSLPKWNLLSYNVNVEASSSEEGYPPSNVADENIKTVWKAKGKDGEWVKMDLGDAVDVHAIQVNFGDSGISVDVPGRIRGTTQARYIEERKLRTRYILEASVDDRDYFMVEDKSLVETDLSHDLTVKEEGFKARFIRITVIEVPYGQNPAISGLRVFGVNERKEMPDVAGYAIKRISDIDIEIEIDPVRNATGYNVLFGTRENKLYNSYMTFDNKVKVSALVKGKEYFFRVDTFNEKGISKGEVKHE